MAHLKIMLVDDHVEFREVLKTFLEDRDRLEIVAEASDGLEAIEQASLTKPDLILMDISMPRMDGFIATREIKLLVPEASVVFISFYDDPRYKDRARQAGGNGFISKVNLARDLPIMLDLMRRRVDRTTTEVSSDQFLEVPLQGQEEGDRARGG